MPQLTRKQLNRTLTVALGVAVVAGGLCLGNLMSVGYRQSRAFDRILTRAGSITHTTFKWRIILPRRGIVERFMLTFFDRHEEIRLPGSSIRDRDLALIRDLPWIEHLDVSRTRISDAGVGHLERVLTLKSLDLTSTRVTPAAVARLQRTRPDLKVTY